MARFCLILVIFFGFLAPVEAAAGISALRQMLQQRSSEPKLYVPEFIFIDQEIRVLVQAPGAKKIELYGSNEAGQLQLKGVETRLGPDYRKLGEASSSDGDMRKEFVVKLDPEKDQALIDKFYIFEALVSYQDPVTGQEHWRNANYFGSNANFSNNNAVKIMPQPESKRDVAAMARSMIPGLMPKQSQGGF